LAGLPGILKSQAVGRFLAYDLWAGSPMFQAGYKSSLTVLDDEGNLVSHFGFDVPPFHEVIDLPDPPLPEIVLETEVPEPAGPGQPRFLHAHRPVLRSGRLIGIVVGHIPDEPDNLPFLPGSRPYLGSLGVGGPEPEDRARYPEYVLYNAAGVVRHSTLPQPPAWKTGFDIAASEGRTLRLEAGGDPFFALPILEMDRLHLLLLPAPTWLERTSTFVRLYLLGLLLLAVIGSLPHLVRPGGLRELVADLRGSFYRKLAASLLLASVLPLVGLSLTLKEYIESRYQAALLDEAVQRALVAQRVVEDYAGLQPSGEGGGGPDFSDHLMSWLRRVIGQEIHLYENGVLVATSKRELFASGLLLPRLPGDVYRSILQENRPPMVLPVGLGKFTIPVAYAPVTLADPGRKIVLAVPLILQQQATDRAVGRVVEILVLTTVFLAGVLVVAAAIMARTVARPVRELVEATGRIADGDYATRLPARTRDEIAELVQGFNSMASSLASQRADLTRRKDYMEALLRNATTGVISTDHSGTVVTINPAAASLLASEDTVPGPGDDLAAAVSRNPELAPLAEELGSMGIPGESRDVDLRSGGEPMRVRVVRVDLPDPEGGPAGSLILLEDVTDLMRKNQLEAWAEMARAIAHEIKNPLTPIQLSTEHLERLLRDRGQLPSSELESCLENVIRQVKALRQIAAEFSAYAKLPDLKIRLTDPVEFLRETAAPYRAAPPDGVIIQERLEPCPAVPMDAKALSRAVINLVENALQSMSGGGTLTLETAADRGGGWVRMTVRDTGKGLSPEVRRRLFEPYFSTKSSGTGLGLAIVKRSVEAHGGRIEVHSAENEGTAFHILLPAGEADGGGAHR
jgi:signal transduction histidine kinase